MSKTPIDINKTEINTDIPGEPDIIDDEVYYETDLNDAIREIEESIYQEQKNPKEE